MPIVSRTLIKLANREDLGPGIKRWRIDGVDTLGRAWVHGPFSGTQAEGEALRDSVIWDTEDMDRNNVIHWVRAGNTPDTFDLTGRDINFLRAENYVFSFFAQRKGDEVMNLAWWVDGLTNPKFNQIANRLNFTSAQKNRIKSRAANLAAAASVFDDEVEMN